MQFILQHRGGHRLLTGQHLVGVSADGVDLAVVYDETVRMGSLPTWVRVRAEPGMHHGDCRFIIDILQIAEEGAELSYEEHTFVYDGTAGKRWHVGVVVALFENTAYDVQTTVESDSLFHILRFFDECLHDVRHTLSCLMAENFRNGRHGSPSKEFQSLFFHDDLKHLFCLVPFQLILWEEEYADAVFPFSA